MNFPHLFSPLKVGPYQLGHRLMMAPLTRLRAERPSLAPRPLNAEYYAQRTTPGGLIIAEASPVIATGFGNPGVPGIYSEAQIKGWRAVVDAVHAKGGVIFLQLWHVGRVSHSSYQPGGALPVAPSAVAISADYKTMTADGKVAAYEPPRALETSEVAGVVEAFRQAARNAMAAGFDGVEVHGANGYLIEQFIAVAQQSAHRPVWRFDREPRALPDGGDGGRGRGVGREPGRRAAVALWRRQRLRRGRADAALYVCDPVARCAGACLSAFHRAALERRRPRRGQSPERAVGDGVVPPGLERRPDLGRRLHRRERRGRDRGRPCRRHRVRPHLHFQSRFAAPAAARFTR